MWLVAWLTEFAMAQYRCSVVSDLRDLLLLQETCAAHLTRRWIKSPRTQWTFLLQSWTRFEVW